VPEGSPIDHPLQTQYCCVGGTVGRTANISSTNVLGTYSPPVCLSSEKRLTYTAKVFRGSWKDLIRISSLSIGTVGT